eukprot:CAMPEP_0183375336 /NCGR_PEP_ID=MMETSP0164_2-20130417/117045_1 /TAXON_ID=221442 /ORGANISM="Coccolithus pelagicus ssp braarudi, Strain PLY182g" /LENGTH=60 /DNA_ID=CAMNT_0025552497 /DNA_START=128 /DNA_END=306 /DNA_ORIENTATION=+
MQAGPSTESGWLLPAPASPTSILARSALLSWRLCAEFCAHFSGSPLEAFSPPLPSTSLLA